MIADQYRAERKSLGSVENDIITGFYRSLNRVSSALANSKQLDLTCLNL
jgi:hypothetical protein